MPLLLLKLPADVHTKLAAFVRANDAARFCFAGKEAYKAFGIQQWRACLYAIVLAKSFMHFFGGNPSCFRRMFPE